MIPNAKIIDGMQLALVIQEEIKTRLEQQKSRPPCLVALLTTNHPASLSYVSKKVSTCQKVGISSRVIHIAPKSTSEVLAVIDQLNDDSTVDGILVQLPLPPSVDLLPVLQRIDPRKDVDGFHPDNVGKLLLGNREGFVPCTPLGIKVMLEHSQIEVEGRHVVIVGRSNIVGKPLAALLMQNAPGCNATVTVAHSHTKNLRDICLSADILVAAIGKPRFISADMIKPGAVVVDVGVNTIEDASRKSGVRLVGDVDFDAAISKVQAITPVPGGVGPMTIAMLLQNTLRSFEGYRQNRT